MKNRLKLNVIILIFSIFLTSQAVAADRIIPIPKPTVDQETKKKTEKKKEIYPQKKPTEKTEKIPTEEIKITAEALEESEEGEIVPALATHWKISNDGKTFQFRIDPKDLRNAITDRTRIILINSPHNPTGSVLNEEDIREIYEIAEEYDLYLISDEVYGRMVYEQNKNNRF